MNLLYGWSRLRGAARPVAGLSAAAVVIVVGAGCGIHSAGSLLVFENGAR